MMSRNQDPFGLWGNPLLAGCLLTVWITLAIVFAGEPQWDIAIARWFFDADACAATANEFACAGFPLATSPTLNLIRDILHYMPVVIAVGFIILLYSRIVLEDRHWLTRGNIALWSLVATVIIAPGLIVNGILKAHWGRPRPWMSDVFGGWMEFVPAGSIDGACTSNCSFVSGEAALGAWLLCLTVLFAPSIRLRAGLVLAIVGLFMAGLRLGFGAHYPSDIILGYLLTLTFFAIFASSLRLALANGRLVRLCAGAKAIWCKRNPTLPTGKSASQ